MSPMLYTPPWAAWVVVPGASFFVCVSDPRGAGGEGLGGLGKIEETRHPSHRRYRWWSGMLKGAVAGASPTGPWTDGRTNRGSNPRPRRAPAMAHTTRPSMPLTSFCAKFVFRKNSDGHVVPSNPLRVHGEMFMYSGVYPTDFCSSALRHCYRRPPGGACPPHTPLPLARGRGLEPGSSGRRSAVRPLHHAAQNPDKVWPPNPCIPPASPSMNLACLKKHTRDEAPSTAHLQQRAPSLLPASAGWRVSSS